MRSLLSMIVLKGPALTQLPASLVGDWYSEPRRWRWEGVVKPAIGRAKDAEKGRSRRSSEGAGRSRRDGRVSGLPFDPIQRSSARAKQLHSRGALPVQAARAQGRLAARISARL